MQTDRHPRCLGMSSIDQAFSVLGGLAFGEKAKKVVNSERDYDDICCKY